MVDQKLRRPEAILPRQVIRDHGLRGLERITRGAGEIALNAGMPDDARLPADARTHDELLLFGQIFQNLAEPALQTQSRNTARLLQQFRYAMLFERKTAEFRNKVLLTEPIGQFFRLIAAAFWWNGRGFNHIIHRGKLSRGRKQLFSRVRRMHANR